MGQGDGVAANDTAGADSAGDVDVDDAEPAAELDVTIPYEEAEEEPQIEDIGSENPVRKSTRPSRTPKVFSYDEVGGPPVLVDIRCQLFPD